MTTATDEKIECYPAALTIAGSDSGGGAGVQADLRTFNAFAVFGTSAITALTAQNPGGVRRIDAVPAEGVSAQIDAVMDGFEIGCAKTGMLFNAAIVRAVAAAAEKYRFRLVVDPVMVATSGAKLLEDDAVEAVRELLLPLADWITPNVPEAELLLGRKLSEFDALLAGAEELSRRFRCGVVLKGGHLASGECAADAVAHEGNLYRLESPLLEDCRHSHGTGCTFSAALAANLALNLKPKQALLDAKTFVFGSLAEPVNPSHRFKAMYPPEEDYSGYVKLEKV